MKVLIIFTVILASACAHKDHHYGEDEHYSYGYEVHAPKTGDYHSHEETRKGDKVEGVYTLVEPNGHKRIVHYTADKHSGFRAKVTREPTDKKVPKFHNHHHEYDEEAHSKVHIQHPNYDNHLY